MGDIADTPAFYTYRTNVNLLGSVVFANNTGGALSMTSGQVVANGNIQFTGNRALYGGALSLISSSQVCVCVCLCTVDFNCNEHLGGI